MNIINNLVNFSYKRNWKEAILFFVTYFIIGFIPPILIIFIWNLFSGTGPLDYHQGMVIGEVVGLIFDFVIVLLVLIGRRLYKSFLYIVLSLIAIVFLFLELGILSTAIAAFMTTRGNFIQNKKS